jgi:hypothetical protein
MEALIACFFSSFSGGAPEADSGQGIDLIRAHHVPGVGHSFGCGLHFPGSLSDCCDNRFIVKIALHYPALTGYGRYTSTCD